MLDGLGGLVLRGIVAGAFGVLELVATPPQGTELSESRSELRADGLLDCVVAALGRRPKSLVRQQPGQRLARCVVGKDEGGVRVGLSSGPGRRQRDRCLRQETAAVGSGAGQLLKLTAG